jgi:hypothetical protein
MAHKGDVRPMSWKGVDSLRESLGTEDGEGEKGDEMRMTCTWVSGLGDRSRVGGQIRFKECA